MNKLSKVFIIVSSTFIFASGGELSGNNSSDYIKSTCNKNLCIPVERLTLHNGLRIVLSPNDNSNTVAVAVYYNAGSRVEKKGKSGLAHLFEHMMFQGTKNIKKGDYFKIISSHGGEFNGSTQEDYANYYEELPADMLEVALFLEADRMTSLELNETNFENQRTVVLEEKMSQWENEAYIPSFIEINKLAYEGWWPYSHPVIGETEDIKKFQLMDAIDFYKKFYNPASAVLVISGKFEKEKVLKMIKKYFENIKGANPIFPEVPQFNRKHEEKHKVIIDKYANLPAFHMAYNIPQMRSLEYYPLKLVAMALGDGDSSRYYRKLVKEKQMVSQYHVDVDGRNGPDLFSIFMILNENVPLDEVKKEVEMEINSIIKNGIENDELNRVKKRIKMKYLSAFESNLGTALMLGKYELLWQDATEVNNEIEKFLSVTSDEIKTVSSQFLISSNRSIIDVLPSTGSEEMDGK